MADGSETSLVKSNDEQDEESIVDWRNYMSVKRKKLNSQNEEMRADIKHLQQLDDSTPGEIDEPTEIFKGLRFHINGHTTPSFDDLKRLILLNGGNYDYYYSKTNTDFMIATNLAFTKIQKVRDEKIVRPEFIVDSIKAKKVLPHKSYQLYANALIKDQQTLSQMTNSATKSPPKNNLIPGPSNVQPHSSTESDTQVNSGPNSPSFLNSSSESKRNVSSGSDLFGSLPPSPSMIDMDFLDSLPADVRQELLNEYPSRSAQKPQPAAVTAQPKILPQKTTKGKQSKKTAIKEKKLPVTYGPMDRLLKRKPEPCSNTPVLEQPRFVPITITPKQATLSKKSDIDIIICLIREWVDTEEDLLDEDLAAISKYFFDLIEEKNFENLELAAKTYYESVMSRASLPWKEAYNNIILMISSELDNETLKGQKIRLPICDLPLQNDNLQV